MKKTLFFLLSYLSTLPAFADMGASHGAGQFLAQGIHGSVQGAAKGTAASTVPGFVTDIPSQTSLTDKTMESAASSEAARSEAGQFLTKASEERKRFVLDAETDPLLKVGNEVLKDPHTVLDVKLDMGAEERGVNITLTCEEAGDPIEQTCHHNLHVEIEITPGWVEEHWKCGGYQRAEYSDRMGGDRQGAFLGYRRYYHNNNNPGCLRDRCAKDHVRIEHPEIINVTKEEWVEDCGRLEKMTDEGRCQYVSKVCSDGPSTKMVQGRPITKDCWQYKQTYNCKYPSLNSCSPLRAKGCLQKASRCKEKAGGTCVVWEQTYECPSSKRKLKNIRAGVGSPFCITGNCADSSYQANGEMLEVMAKLSVFKEMQNDVRSGSFEVFKGLDKRCSRNCVSFKDCCQNMKGWGTSLHLASCSEEERLLAQLKSKDLCHQVGTYCAKKVLGVCVSKKTTYCCFGNKLLRLIQQQGRAQLGIGWGEASNPCCRGLKTEELGRIDFSRIDFSEIFEDIMATFKQPDVSSLQTRAAENLKENVRQIQAGTKKQPLNTGEAGAL